MMAIALLTPQIPGSIPDFVPISGQSRRCFCGEPAAYRWSTAEYLYCPRHAQVTRKLYRAYQRALYRARSSRSGSSKRSPSRNRFRESW